MKNLILFLLLVFFSSAHVIAQVEEEILIEETDITEVQAAEAPAAVKAGLLKKYPAAKDIFWFQNEEDASIWIVEFQLSDKLFSADFDGKGNWLATYNTLDETEIPQKIKSKISQQIPKYDILDAEKKTQAAGDSYKIWILDSESMIYYDIKIDVEGNLTKEAFYDDTAE